MAETLRNYDIDSKQCEFYKRMYKNQNLNFVLMMKEKYITSILIGGKKIILNHKNMLLLELQQILEIFLHKEKKQLVSGINGILPGCKNIMPLLSKL